MSVDPFPSFMQINLFKSVEEMIKIFDFCAMRCSRLDRFLQKRFKPTYTVKCDSRCNKVAFLWGDGIKDIIEQCRKEKEVNTLTTMCTSIIVFVLQKSNPDDIEDLLQKIQIYLQSSQ